jgi:hypothetical protein
MITNFKIYEEYSSDFKKYVIFKFPDSNVIILFEVSHKWGNYHRVKEIYRNDNKGFRESNKKNISSFTTSLLKNNIISEFDELPDAIEYFKIYLQSQKYNI